MIKKYSLFRENMDQAKSIMAKKMEAFEKLKKLLEKNGGYLGKFTEYLMYENVSYDDLVILYNKLLSLKSRSKNIDINDLKYEKVLDKIMMTENDISVNSLINRFPSEQKDIAKKMIMNGKEVSRNSYYNMFLKIANKENIEAFTSKISRYKDTNSLFNAASIFSKDSKNEVKNVKEKINSLKSEIVFEDENTLLVRVDSNADLKILASDASWCILSPSTWTTYVQKGRKQFMLLDYTKDEFDPKFKIGFTLNPNGSIYAAHDILDKSANSILEPTLKERGITLTGLMKVEPKTELTSSNSLESIKDFIGAADIDVVKKNTPKILDKLGYGKNKGGFTSYDLTAGKLVVLSKLVVKLFGAVPVISKELIDAIDSRLYRYCCDNTTSTTVVKTKFIRPDVMLVDSKTFDAIKFGLSIWTDSVIVSFSDNIRHIFKSGKDYSSFNDSNFSIDRESIILLSDRLNKIYNDKSFDETVKCEGFYKSLVMLNYAIGRGESTPDHDKLIKYIPSYVYDSYIGLLEDDVDISKKYISLGYGDYPIEKIRKKDYPDSEIYIMSNNVSIIVPRLLEHLKGYKLKICIKKDGFASILHKILNSDDVYLKTLSDTMKKFPARLRVGQMVENGNLILEIR